METGPDLEKIAAKDTHVNRRAVLRTIGGIAAATMVAGVGLTKPEAASAQSPNADQKAKEEAEIQRIKAEATARAQAVQIAAAPTPTSRVAGVSAPKPSETPPQISPAGQENKGGWIAPTVITASGTTGAIWGLSKLKRFIGNMREGNRATQQTQGNVVDAEFRRVPPENAEDMGTRPPTPYPGLPDFSRRRTGSPEESRGAPRVVRGRRRDFVKNPDGTYSPRQPDSATSTPSVQPGQGSVNGGGGSQS